MFATSIRQGLRVPGCRFPSSSVAFAADHLPYSTVATVSQAFMDQLLLGSSIGFSGDRIADPSRLVIEG